MYAGHKLPGTLDGIDTMQFWSYWNAIKNRIAELQNLPAQTTAYGMKLGMVVSNLRNKGMGDKADLLADAARIVNDDIAKAWKVKEKIDKYLPDWMASATAVQSGDSNAISAAGAAQPDTIPFHTTVPNPMAAPMGIGPIDTAPLQYQEPSTFQTFTGWVSSWFGGGGVSAFPHDKGLGVASIIVIGLGASAFAALAYVVTVGLALLEKYKIQSQATQAVIEGKLTSGQGADLIRAAGQPTPSGSGDWGDWVPEVLQPSFGNLGYYLMGGAALFGLIYAYGLYKSGENVR